jgi:hypothetical protein
MTQIELIEERIKAEYEKELEQLHKKTPKSFSKNAPTEDIVKGFVNIETNAPGDGSFRWSSQGNQHNTPHFQFGTARATTPPIEEKKEENIHEDIKSGHSP